jgi:carbamoylphosphate synthase small subunit
MTSPTACSCPTAPATRRRPANMPCRRSSKLIDSGIPVFGICLGHQMLALALGGKTVKMHQGHHGANHPVKDHTTGKVEIVSMNHGFAVDSNVAADGVTETHVSLFDGSNCGLRWTASRCSRCSITRKPRPARRTATTCSAASST